MRKQPGIAVQHPRKIHAFENLFCEQLDLMVRAEISGHGQNTRKKERGVDARNFRIQPARAGPRVREMVEPAMFMKGVRPVMAQRDQRSRTCLLLRNPTVLGCNTECRQTESRRGGTARVSAGRRAICPRAIHENTRSLVPLLPEIAETSLLVVFEKCALIRLERSGCWVGKVRRSRTTCRDKSAGSHPEKLSARQTCVVAAHVLELKGNASSLYVQSRCQSAQHEKCFRVLIFVPLGKVPDSALTSRNGYGHTPRLLFRTRQRAQTEEASAEEIPLADTEFSNRFFQKSYIRSVPRWR